MHTARIQERAELSGTIDEKRRAVNGVAILGRVSQNNRVYSEGALRSLAKLAEGARVYVNHRDERTKWRDVREWLGLLTEVRHEPGKVRGTLVVHNANYWPLVKAAVEAGRSGPGLSIDGMGRFGEKNGREVVEMVSLSSVDFVDQPATNGGMFEAVGGGADRDGDCETSLVEAFASPPGADQRQISVDISHTLEANRFTPSSRRAHQSETASLGDVFDVSIEDGGDDEAQSLAEAFGG